MLQEKSFGAVVFLKQGAQTRYLLLNYTGRYWGFVKGGMEQQESEKETVIRELKEETGITDAHFIDGFREVIDYSYCRKGITFHKVVILYLMEAQSELIKLSCEHKGYVWLGYEDAINKLLFENGKDVLEEAHTFLINKGILKKQ